MRVWVFIEVSFDLDKDIESVFVCFHYPLLDMSQIFKSSVFLAGVILTSQHKIVSL